MITLPEIFMNKTALITGASSGIGRELAKIHAENGGDLVIVARGTEKLQELKAELESEHGVKVFVISKDLAEPEAPREIFKTTQGEGIEIEYLINNAGFGNRGFFHEQEWQKNKNMIAVNITALTELTRLYLPGFVQKGQGRIMNVASTASLTPGPLQAVYFASKAYVRFFNNAVAEEVRDTGVTLTALLPGATETQFAKVAEMGNTDMFQNAASARSVAEKGYEAMMAGELEVLAGVSFSQRLLLAAIPFVPQKVRLRMIKQMQSAQ